MQRHHQETADGTFQARCNTRCYSRQTHVFMFSFESERARFFSTHLYPFLWPQDPSLPTSFEPKLYTSRPRVSLAHIHKSSLPLSASLSSKVAPNPLVHRTLISPRRRRSFRRQARYTLDSSRAHPSGVRLTAAQGQQRSQPSSRQPSSHPIRESPARSRNTNGNTSVPLHGSGTVHYSTRIRTRHPISASSPNQHEERRKAKKQPPRGPIGRP